MAGSDRGQPEALPIACSLTPAESARRAEDLRGGVLAAATGVERLPDGVRFSFRDTRDLFVRLAPVIDAERCCCPFLRFSVTAAPGLGEVVLEITGPDGAAQFLEDWIPGGAR